ncbi:MAG: ATP synthase F1 subunit delta [Oscillospiraceae bacterium]|nr:ATP synthase F1 subunit delta [Oscillospiraceae bacterium]
MTTQGKEYGVALYSLAAEDHCEDEVFNGLSMVADVFAENPGYITLVQNPAISKEERLELLDKAFQGNVHNYVLYLLKLLCERFSLSTVFGCLQEFKTLLYEARNILPVTVISAVPLSEEQQNALQSKLSAKVGKTVLLEISVDPSVLGGIKLCYNGLELDGTTAGRLEALRRNLIQA